MPGADGTFVSDSMLGRIVSQLESLTNSHQVLLAKLDALADVLADATRIAADPALSHAYLSSVVSDSSYVPPHPMMWPAASMDFDFSPVSSVPQSEIEQIAQMRDDQLMALYLRGAIPTYPGLVDAPGDRVQSDVQGLKMDTPLPSQSQEPTEALRTLGTEHDNSSSSQYITNLRNLHTGLNSEGFSVDDPETTSQAAPATPTGIEFVEGLSLDTSNPMSLFGRTGRSHELSEHPSELDLKPMLTSAEDRGEDCFTGTVFGSSDWKEFEKPYENAQMATIENLIPKWGASSPPTLSRSTSSLKAPPSRPRIRTTPRHQHHQYLDSLLRSKCPKDRQHALTVAIQFRDDNVDQLIPNELLDELLEDAGKEKYFCFCCTRLRKARTITPARDHVRKSLGNFTFTCPNPWCRHSSLRQADLTKHLKTCKRPL